MLGPAALVLIVTWASAATSATRCRQPVGRPYPQTSRATSITSCSFCS